MRFTISAELLRDVLDCIQAAKDAVPRDSIFARQLDLVLDKTKLETGATLTTRSTDQDHRIQKVSRSANRNERGPW